MRILGIDYGERRIGLALSDLMGVLAHPAGTVERLNNAQAAQEIAEVADREDVEVVVVGLPVSLDGEERQAAAAVRRFAEVLAKHMTVGVVFQDERMTTAEVEKLLLTDDVSRAGRRKVRDQLAATLMLQSYLDARRGAPR